MAVRPPLTRYCAACRRGELRGDVLAERSPLRPSHVDGCRTRRPNHQVGKPGGVGGCPRHRTALHCIAPHRTALPSWRSARRTLPGLGQACSDCCCSSSLLDAPPCQLYLPWLTDCTGWLCRQRENVPAMEQAMPGWHGGLTWDQAVWPDMVGGRGLSVEPSK